MCRATASRTPSSIIIITMMIINISFIICTYCFIVIADLQRI